MIDPEQPHGPPLSQTEQIAFVDEALAALERNGIYYTRQLRSTWWLEPKDVAKRVDEKVQAVDGKHTQEERYDIEVAAWREYLTDLKTALGG